MVEFPVIFKQEHLIQMMPFPNPILLLLLLMPCVWGKCIFDEVQSSIRVLSPPDNRSSPSDWAFKEDDVKREVSVNEQEDWLTHVQIQNHQKAILQYSPSQRSKRMTRDRSNVIDKPQPIRIKTWTPRESPVLSQWETERLEAAVSDAINTVSKLLAVWRVNRKLLLSRDINKYCRFIWRNSSSANFNKCGRASDNYRTESCLGVTIPDDHLSGCVVYPHPDQTDLKVIKPDGVGIPDTDVLLYVKAQSTDKCRADSSVLAYSAHCQSNSEGRPVAGVMVICREPLSIEGFSHEHMVQTVIHELLHVLGFSKELFSKWTDRSLSSQIGMDSFSHGQVIYTDESGQMRLCTPNVNKALHTHLNTTHTDLGAPLENQDADSRGFSSHWEARVLQGSIMTAMLTEPALVRIDVITLSALQDTGWYSVNLSQAQNLLWGENEGAFFGSVSTCKRSSSFFCTGSGFGCHYLHLHKGVCQSDQYLEGCRIYKPLANGSECWKEENETGSGPEVWSGEIFRSDSRCFLSNIIKEDHFSFNASVTGRCYRHRCTGKNRYQIQVMGSDWLDCPPGRSIKVFGYRGAVFCPDKRLCHYHDTAPLSSLHKPLPSLLLLTAPPSRDQSLTQRPITGLKFDAALPFSEMSVMTVVGVSAVTFFLGSLIIIYRKCCPSRLRVHALIQSPYALQV
ncbi:ciliated left-right organizer metallopeptidase isoform X1 [Pangasianodon hypophthalmus]|uniref:ciliated left-right organizer metallopeptidase isoform X1 n=1 Tax=Pangasianodon hypophthalmus TaxID=310915 RepID=UPI0023077883|nr:ciliated left-right organizer metallopeptidase isoform X1 [Pangasianodon hypophthalmus]